MAFFDELGKKLSAAAGTAADKAKDLGEVTKLKTQILGVQSDINSSLLELGRKVYEQEKRNPESAYAADCAAITGLHEQVESLRARLRWLNPMTPPMPTALSKPRKPPQKKVLHL